MGFIPPKKLIKWQLFQHFINNERDKGTSICKISLLMQHDHSFLSLQDVNDIKATSLMFIAVEVCCLYFTDDEDCNYVLCDVYGKIKMTTV